MRNPEIIFENDNFLAINKPAGLLVHHARISKSQLSDVRGQMSERTLADWLIQKYPQLKSVGDEPNMRPGIVHRLDKDTSGIILVPKTQEYFSYLKKLFQEHEIKKTYKALVWGAPKNPEGTITKPIGIKEGTTKRSVHSEKMAKEAVTTYTLIKTFGEGEETYTMLDVRPETGRTHQIRIHLSSVGHPVLGDAFYGSKPSRALSKKLGITRQMLHAVSLEFAAHDGTAMRFEADIPEDISRLVL